MKKKLISNSLLTLFAIFLAVYISKHHQQFQPLVNINSRLIIIIAISILITIYLNGLFIKIILKPYNKNISSNESFFVALISSMGNYFLPMGTGVGVKAIYLKKKFNLSYTDFVATLSGNYILVFLINSGLGVLAIIMLRNSTTVLQTSFLLLILGGIFCSTFILAIYGFPKWLISYFNQTKFLTKFSKRILQVLKGWNTISKDRNIMYKLITLTFINFFISAFIFFIAMTALRLPTNVWVLVLYTALSSLSLLFNVTPGSIGLKESMFILISTTLSLTVAQILSISIVVNGILLIVLILSWFLLQINPIKKRFIPTEIQ